MLMCHVSHLFKFNCFKLFGRHRGRPQVVQKEDRHVKRNQRCRRRTCSMYKPTIKNSWEYSLTHRDPKGEEVAASSIVGSRHVIMSFSLVLSAWALLLGHSYKCVPLHPFTCAHTHNRSTCCPRTNPPYLQSWLLSADISHPRLVAFWLFRSSLSVVSRIGSPRDTVPRWFCWRQLQFGTVNRCNVPKRRHRETSEFYVSKPSPASICFGFFCFSSFEPMFCFLLCRFY